MSRIKVINEQNSQSLVFNLEDEDGEPAVPERFEYRIDCLEGGEAIRDWTNVTPAAEIVVPLTSQDNAMVNADREWETHVVTVRANYAGSGDPDYLTEEVRYRVKNLAFLE